VWWSFKADAFVFMLIVKQAESISDALKQISEINTTSSFGRNGELWRELFVLKLGLDKCLNSRNAQFPVNVKKSESPDFIVVTGCDQFGIEITEAIKEVDARERREFEKSDKTSMFLGEFGGSRVLSPSQAAKSRAQEIQRAIEKKEAKSGMYSLPTDLLIYPTGNSTLYTTPDATSEQTKFYDAIENRTYVGKGSFQNIWLVDNTREPKRLILEQGDNN